MGRIWLMAAALLMVAMMLPSSGASEEVQARVEDPCFRYTLIKISCRKHINFCETDEQCGGELICCPYGRGCGTRCVRAPPAVPPPPPDTTAQAEVTTAQAEIISAAPAQEA